MNVGRGNALGQEQVARPGGEQRCAQLAPVRVLQLELIRVGIGVGGDEADPWITPLGLEPGRVLGHGHRRAQAQVLGLALKVVAQVGYHPNLYRQNGHQRGRERGNEEDLAQGGHPVMQRFA